MKKYKSLIFDCDGVILNSNKIKTESFAKVLKEFNSNAIEEFIDYHKNNGGISRYKKIDHFLINILPKYSKSLIKKNDKLLSLLENYGRECKQSLYNSEVTSELEKLRALTQNITWLIVSGGDQKELRDVFEYKNLSKYFNGGIFGSPDNKFDIVKRKINDGLINYPALFLGDSKLDYIVAKQFNIDFLFVTDWTDYKDFNCFCKKNSIDKINSVSDLIKIFKNV